MSESWKRLIDGLLERRIVKRRQLEDVLRRMRPRPETVEKVLVESGLVTRSQLLSLKGELYGLETIDLSTVAIDATTALLLPQPMAERYTAVCIGRNQRTLILAAAEPLDAISVDYLRMRAGFEVKVLLTYAGDLLEIRRRIYEGQAQQGAPLAGGATGPRPSALSDEALRRPVSLETITTAAPARRIRLPDDEPTSSGDRPVSARPAASGGMAVLRSVPVGDPGDAPAPARAPALRPIWKPETPPMREPMRVPLREPGCRLCKATLAMDRGLDENVLLEKILEQGMVEIDAEAASLLLLEDDGRSLFFKVATGTGKDEIVNLLVPLDEDSVARWVLTHGEPTMVQDARNTPQHNKETDKLLRFSTRTLVAVPVKWGSRVVGVVEGVNRRHGRFTLKDIESLQVVASQMSMVLRNDDAQMRLSNLLMESVELAVELMQTYGTVSRAHLVNVAQLATAVGREAGLAADMLETLTHAGMLHDIGLAGPSEQDERQHGHRGAAILERIPALRPIVPAVQYHHERWDGSGPFGLKEEQIPLLARILAVAEEWCECKPWEQAALPAFSEAFLDRFGVDFDPALQEPFIHALDTTRQQAGGGG